MLLLGIITLIITIPLASVCLSSILIHRIVFLILLLSVQFSCNTLHGLIFKEKWLLSTSLITKE